MLLAHFTGDLVSSSCAGAQLYPNAYSQCNVVVYQQLGNLLASNMEGDGPVLISAACSLRQYLSCKL